MAFEMCYGRGPRVRGLGHPLRCAPSDVLSKEPLGGGRGAVLVDGVAHGTPLDATYSRPVLDGLSTVYWSPVTCGNGLGV